MGMNTDAGVGWKEMLEGAKSLRKAKAERQERMAGQYRNVLDTLKKLDGMEGVLGISLIQPEAGPIKIEVVCDGQQQGINPLISRDVVRNIDLDDHDAGVVYIVEFEDEYIDVASFNYQETSVGGLGT